MSKASREPKSATMAGTPQQAREEFIDEKSIDKRPGGFMEVMGERAVGFFAMQAGNAIQGVLRDTFETKSKFARKDGSTTKRVYKIEVTADDPAGRGPTLYHSSDEDKQDKLQEAHAGDLIGVDEKGWLKSLEKVVVGQEVWVFCQGKQPPSAEYPQGAWIFKVTAKPCKANPVTGEVTS